MTNKSIDLVVACIMHEAVGFDELVERIETLSQQAGQKLSKKQRASINAQLAEKVARKLLCEVSHQCPLTVVLAALAAVKAPATAPDILEGLQAVRDKQ